MFVAIGSQGVILTTADGGTFSEPTSGTAGNLHGVAVGNTTFVAVGSSGTILSSGYGLVWSVE